MAWQVEVGDVFSGGADPSFTYTVLKQSPNPLVWEVQCAHTPLRYKHYVGRVGLLSAIDICTGVLLSRASKHKSPSVCRCDADHLHNERGCIQGMCGCRVGKCK